MLNQKLFDVGSDVGFTSDGLKLLKDVHSQSIVSMDLSSLKHFKLKINLGSYLQSFANLKSLKLRGVRVQTSDLTALRSKGFPLILKHIENTRTND